MRPIQDLTELERRIEELESLKEVQKKELQEDFRQVAHQLSPATLIRSGVQTVISTPGLKTTAIDTAISTGAGYVTKKLVTRKSHNIFRHIAGWIAQFAVANLIRNKIPGLRRKL